MRQRAAGRSVEACRQYSFSDQLLERRKAKYRGIEIGDAKRLQAPGE